jgi:hypothetical protein
MKQHSSSDLCYVGFYYPFYLGDYYLYELVDVSETLAKLNSAKNNICVNI